MGFASAQPILRLGRMLRRSINVASSGQQACDGNILVDGFPVQTDAADFDLLTFGRLRAQQARELGKRYAQRPPVGQFDPHGVLVKANASCRNGHARLSK